MKLSKNTVNILKNFAGINSNILLKAGTKISTISPQKNLFGTAVIAESIPIEFGIYDLNEFLSVYSLFADPDLSFTEKYILVKEVGNSVKFYAAEASLLAVPLKEVVFPDPEITFKLPTNTLSLIQRASGVLNQGTACDLSFIGNSQNIIACVSDKKNASSNSYEVPLGLTDKTFKVNMKVENHKVIPGDYTVSISSKRISKFEGLKDLIYYIALESDSTFE